MKWAQTMPFYIHIPAPNWIELIGTLIYPIALSLQLPVYLYLLVLEKTDNLKDLMNAHGLKNHNYILSSYLFSLLLYITVVTCFYLMAVTVNIRLFVHTNPWILILFLMAWGFSMISLSFFVATFVKSKR